MSCTLTAVGSVVKALDFNLANLDSSPSQCRFIDLLMAFERASDQNCSRAPEKSHFACGHI